ncbi:MULTISPECIES: arylsulfotransferase family protein [Salinibaculum]|uniref:arylsulfotransferase family protein n=1 Tax=Salinibaculum TaxID=2732368 RepID=UPI0030D22576
MPSRKRTVRVALLVAIVVLAAPTAIDFLTQEGTTAAAPDAVDTPEVTVNSTATLDRPKGHVAYVVDAQGPGQLTILNRTTGEVVYRTTEYNLYHDVDPSPAGRYTVQYVASIILGNEQCPDDIEGLCTRNVVDRLNYSTGERERLYARTLNYNGSSNTHDVDRVDEDRFLIGDIQFDRVYTVDVGTGEIDWVWNAAAEFDRSTGGKKGDWTHLNDVEIVEEGLYMVNLRNQDQVVFVDREEGMLENMTLGAEDDYDILYEQHNPDYIPEERGGPAILVADSENSRIVEYQRRNGTWNRSWTWADETIQWPRDADRLPNNNTLITDTHGTRLVEVTPNGSIVWEHTVPRGVYEAELLWTGDESRSGRSMAAIQGVTNVSNATDYGGVSDSLERDFRELFPSLVLNGFLYVLPTWISPLAGAMLLLATVLAALWLLGEVGRYGYLRFR